MPSWQAQILNLATRAVQKPFVQFASLDLIRRSAARMDARIAKRMPDDLTILRDGGQAFRAEWIQIKASKPQRVLMYLPGGAFVVSTPARYRRFVGRFCRLANVKAYLVHYGVAPEFPYPHGLNDAIAAYKVLLERGYDPNDIILGGDSAGGGLALSLLLSIRDQGLPLPARAVLISPLADLSYSGASRQFNRAKDPAISDKRASGMHQLYIGDHDTTLPYLSPAFASFERLPPIFAQVGSTEILLSDSENAFESAEKAGTEFHFETWTSMPHIFPVSETLPEAHDASDRIAEFIASGRVLPMSPRRGVARSTNKA